MQIRALFVMFISAPRYGKSSVGFQPIRIRENSTMNSNNKYSWCFPLNRTNIIFIDMQANKLHHIDYCPHKTKLFRNFVFMITYQFFGSVRGTFNLHSGLLRDVHVHGMLSGSYALLGWQKKVRWLQLLFLISSMYFIADFLFYKNVITQCIELSTFTKDFQLLASLFGCHWNSTLSFL